MASLYIKDSQTAARVDRLAQRLGETKTATVNRALQLLEEQVQADDPPPKDFVAWMKWHRARNPLPPKVADADKAFFDEMWGEEP
jgi:antitoxin VapB